MASQLIPMAPAQPAPAPPAAAPVSRGGAGARRADAKAGPSDFDHLVASFAQEDDGMVARGDGSADSGRVGGQDGRAPGRELPDPAPVPDGADDPTRGAPPPMTHLVVDRLTVCELPATVPGNAPGGELSLETTQGQIADVAIGEEAAAAGDMVVGAADVPEQFAGASSPSNAGAAAPMPVVRDGAAEAGPTVVASDRTSSAAPSAPTLGGPDRVERLPARTQVQGPQADEAAKGPAAASTADVERVASRAQSSGLVDVRPTKEPGPERQTVGRGSDTGAIAMQPSVPPPRPEAVANAAVETAAAEEAMRVPPTTAGEIADTAAAPEIRPDVKAQPVTRRPAAVPGGQEVTSVGEGLAPVEGESTRTPAGKAPVPATPKHREHLEQLAQQLRGLEPARTVEQAPTAPVAPVLPEAGSVANGADSGAGNDTSSEPRAEARPRATAAIRSFKSIEAAFVPAFGAASSMSPGAVSAAAAPRAGLDITVGAGQAAGPVVTSAGAPVSPLITAPVEPFVLASRATDGAPETLHVPEAPLDLGPFDGEPHEQVVKAVRLQWQQGVGEARLTLRPEHLGEVTVTLKIDNGAVAATLKADTPAAAEWIRSHQADLRSSLDGQGLSLESLEVGVDPEGRRRQPAREREQEELPRHRRRPETDLPRFDIHV